MLKFGFFDSVDGDRKYNSRDVAEIFDGIITDGIYAQIGERFSVNPKSVVESSEDQMTVTVGTGQAWLSHTKVLNTSRMEFTLSEGIGANRYDAIILEINDNTRNVDIFVKSNVTTKTNNPNTKFDLADGQLVRTEFVHQYLLAVILVEGGASKITAANIASKIGFDIPDGVPYITCPLDPFPADETLKQWNSQWYGFFNKAEADFKEAQQDRSTQFNAFMINSEEAFTNAQDERNADYQELRALIVDWLNSTETDWDTWYASVKNNFEGYVDGAVAQHNESTESHSDMRDDIQTLLTRLNALADSDDETLDQLSEIVAYIKNNRDLIRELSSGGLTEEDLNNTLKNYLTKTDANNTFLKLIGGSLTGPLHIVGRDKGIQLVNDDGTIASSFHIGTGGTNRGIYNEKVSEWAFYIDANNDLYIGQSKPAKLVRSTGDMTIAGNLTAKNYPTDVSNAPINFVDTSSFFYSGDSLKAAIGYLRNRIIFFNGNALLKKSSGKIISNETREVLYFPSYSVSYGYLIFLYTIQESTGKAAGAGVRFVTIGQNGTTPQALSIATTSTIHFSTTISSEAISLKSGSGYITYYDLYPLTNYL